MFLFYSHANYYVPIITIIYYDGHNDFLEINSKLKLHNIHVYNSVLTRLMI